MSVFGLRSEHTVHREYKCQARLTWLYSDGHEHEFFQAHAKLAYHLDFLKLLVLAVVVLRKKGRRVHNFHKEDSSLQ